METKLTLAALSSFSEAYTGFCKPICRELGIPQMAFDILMFLANNPEHRTAREISRFRGFKENVISVNVNKLVNEGYLLRENDRGDRRKIQLRCTEKADSIIRRGRALQEEFICRMFSGLSQEELRVHAHCLETIAENAKKLLENR